MTAIAAIRYQFPAGTRSVRELAAAGLLESSAETLETLGFERHQARNLALRFRRHNLEQLALAAPHFKDDSKLIALAKIGRQQMESFMAEERKRKDGGGMGGDAAEVHAQDKR